MQILNQFRSTLKLKDPLTPLTPEFQFFSFAYFRRGSTRSFEKLGQRTHSRRILVFVKDAGPSVSLHPTSSWQSVAVQCFQYVANQVLEVLEEGSVD